MPGHSTHSLSPRERQVLALITEGLTYYQTARQLGISVHTVSTYLRRIRAKHTAPTLADLVRFGLTQQGVEHRESGSLAALAANSPLDAPVSAAPAHSHGRRYGARVEPPLRVAESPSERRGSRPGATAEPAECGERRHPALGD